MRVVRKTQSSKKNRRTRAFTIVEVLIVLAIAGLIMGLIFLAIPQLQSSRRDLQRRDYAKRVFSEMLGYFKNADCDSSAFPGSCDAGKVANAKSFIINYMPDGVDPLTGDAYTSSSIQAGTGEVHTTSGSTYFIYDAAHVDHAKIPALGQVLIESSHWCYSSKPDSGPTTNPIASSSYAAAAQDLGKFVILIGTEKGQYLCTDNY